MAALISWRCDAEHNISDRSASLPAVTLYEGKWAYCPHDGNGDHTWNAIEPVPLEMLRFRHVESAGMVTEESRPE